MFEYFIERCGGNEKMTYTTRVTTINELHTRPCIKIVNTSQSYGERYPGLKIRIKKLNEFFVPNYEWVDSSSMMGLTMLAAKENMELEIKVSGDYSVEIKEGCGELMAKIIRNAEGRRSTILKI
jgi:phosphotransferase system HPr-like phosphotransfer protein